MKSKLADQLEILLAIEQTNLLIFERFLKEREDWLSQPGGTKHEIHLGSHTALLYDRIKETKGNIYSLKSDIQDIDPDLS